MTLLDVASHDARRLLTVAATDWQRPVPHCPAWDARALVRHTGGVLAWMAAVVASRQAVSRSTVKPAPEQPADLPAWYASQLDRTLLVLRSAEPGSETWTFSSTGDRQVGWWWRRLAVEMAIHRWDIEHAAASGGDPAPTALDRDVAGAGIEEFVIEFLPGLLAQEDVHDLGGTLHLHATDGSAEWWIDLDAAGSARPEHAKADTAVRGTQSDLLLWLTNREPSDSLEVLGSREILRNWRQLQR